MTAIVGPTGAGKTTAVSILLRLYDCEAGKVFIDGDDIREFTLTSLKDHMAYVSQDTLLFNETLRNNIIYGVEEPVSEDRLVYIIEQAQLEDFVKQLPQGIDTLVGDRGVKLSGGEQQRASIARAMLKGSEILILDEATSSLDTNTELLIQSAIEKAIHGRTTIVIAHRLSTIKHADWIVFLDKGQVVEQGTMDDLLLKKGRFYKSWEQQRFY